MPLEFSYQSETVRSESVRDACAARGLNGWEIDIWSFLRVLLRHARFLAVSTVLGFGFSYFAVVSRDLHEAETEFLIGPLNLRGETADGFFESEVKFLTSPDLAFQALTRFSNENPTDAKGLKKSLKESDAQTALRIAQRVTAGIDPTTGQAWLRYADRDPARAVAITRLIRQTYHASVSKRYLAKVDRAKDWAQRAILLSLSELERFEAGMTESGISIRGATLKELDLDQTFRNEERRIEGIKIHNLSVANSNLPSSSGILPLAERFLVTELNGLRRQVEIDQIFRPTSDLAAEARALTLAREQARQANAKRKRRNIELEIQAGERTANQLAVRQFGNTQVSVYDPRALRAENILPGLTSWHEGVLKNHALVEAHSLSLSSNDLERDRLLDEAALLIGMKQAEHANIMIAGGLLGFFAGLMFVSLSPWSNQKPLRNRGIA